MATEVMRVASKNVKEGGNVHGYNTCMCRFLPSFLVRNYRIYDIINTSMCSVSVVSFNHRSVFPIMFDGTAVDNWWKSALVFKLFARSAGQKVVGSRVREMKV
jgi:hypothetical protein